jgi:hypothetical protein
VWVLRPLQYDRDGLASFGAWHVVDTTLGAQPERSGNRGRCLVDAGSTRCEKQCRSGRVFAECTISAGIVLGTVEAANDNRAGWQARQDQPGSGQDGVKRRARAEPHEGKDYTARG